MRICVHRAVFSLCFTKVLQVGAKTHDPCTRGHSRTLQHTIQDTKRTFSGRDVPLIVRGDGGIAASPTTLLCFVGLLVSHRRCIQGSCRVLPRCQPPLQLCDGRSIAAHLLSHPGRRVTPVWENAAACWKRALVTRWPRQLHRCGNLRNRVATDTASNCICRSSPIQNYTANHAAKAVGGNSGSQEQIMSSSRSLHSACCSELEHRVQAAGHWLIQSPTCKQPLRNN